MRRSLTIPGIAFASVLAAAGTAGATTFYLSTQGGPVVPSLPGSRGGDIVQYDDASPGSAFVFFNEDTFAVAGPGPEVDAFEILDDGRMYFSTTGPATLGTNSLSFVNGDVVEYDPATGLAAKIFDEQASFTGQADIDAIAILPNGHLLFSTAEDENGLAGAPNVLDGDVVEWDPLTDSYVGIYFPESAFGSDIDLDAFDVLPDGRYALSTLGTASLGGLTNFSGSDLILYDVNTDTAVIWLDSSIFGDPGNSPLDAVAVPEPGSSALLALGLVGLAVAGRRRTR